MSLWGAVASANGGEELILAFKAFSEQASDTEALKDEAPLLAETVLVGRPQGIVEVLEASFKSDGEWHRRSATARFRARGVQWLGDVWYCCDGSQRQRGNPALASGGPRVVSLTSP